MSAHSSSVKSTHIVQVPATCSLEHTAVTLENGVRIVVTVDPNTNTSSAAGSVFVGSHWDPAETPGLAHLCEHMLFLGTKRDPEEGGFDKYLSKNAGHSNAWTEDGVTNYYCQCSNSAFNEAMIRFSHFFVEPTMTPSALEREVQAVHSEDEKNHPVDYWCVEEMKKERLIDRDHPHCRYGNGNAATLWDGPKERDVDLHAVLMKFYEQHYVAENLVVAVYSPIAAKDVIAALEPILIRARSGTRNVHSFSTPASPSTPQRFIDQKGLGSWINMKTNAEAQGITINIPVPVSFDDTVAYNPLHFLSWVFGHECNGTIVDVLRQEDLCTSLSTGFRENDDNNSMFSFQVSLTTKGLKNVDRVIDLVFEGIEYFRQNDFASDKNLFADMVAGDHLGFNMKELRGPSSHTSSIARNCNIYGPEHCWSTVELLGNESMNIELIKKLLGYFTPQNAYYVLSLPDPDQVIANSTSTAAASGEEKTQKDDQVKDEDEDEEDDGEDEENDKSTELKSLPVDRLKACATLATETTTHHKAHYSITPIEESVLAQWGRHRTEFHPAFKRPGQNPFISSDFAVLTKQTDDEGHTWANTEFVPKIVHESKWGRVMWRPDAGLFDSPKASCSVSIESPEAYASSKKRFFVRVLAIVFQYALAELTYFGELGALKVEFESTARGLIIVVLGPREKLFDFASAVLEGIFNEIYNGTTIVNEEKYKACADRVLRSIQSTKVRAPYLQGNEWIYQFSAEHRFHWTEILDDINNTIPPFEEFLSFSRQVLFNSKVGYDLLIVGNVVRSDAIAFAVDNIESKLFTTKLPKTVVPASEADFTAFESSFAPASRAEIGPQYFGTCFSNKSSNPKDVNSSASVFYFQGPCDPETRALSDVVWSLLKAHYFEGLRTRETIGYIVFAQNVNTDYLRWTTFCAQSAKLSAWYIFSRTVAFMKAAQEQVFGDALNEKRRRIKEKKAAEEQTTSENAKDEDFLEAQVREAAKSIASQCRDKPKNLKELVTRIWNVRHSPYGFDAVEREAAVCEDVTKINAKTVRAFFNKYFIDPEHSRPVVSLVHGTAASAEQIGLDKLNQESSSPSQQQKHLVPVKGLLPPREGEVPAVKDDDVATLDMESYREKTEEAEVLVFGSNKYEDYRNWRRQNNKQ